MRATIVPLFLLQKKQPHFSIILPIAWFPFLSSSLFLCSEYSSNCLPLPKSGLQSWTNSQCHLTIYGQNHSSLPQYSLPLPLQKQNLIHFYSGEQCVQIKGYISQTSAKCGHGNKSWSVRWNASSNVVQDFQEVFFKKRRNVLLFPPLF